MKKAEEWSSRSHRWETNKNVSDAPLVVLFQRFTLSTSLQLSTCRLCDCVKSLPLCVDTCGHFSIWNTMRDYFSVLSFPPPLYLCISISSLFPSVSVSLSLTVWPRSCSSIGLEVCNHPLTLLLSQSLPGQTDPGIGKYPPLNTNLLSSLNARRTPTRSCTCAGSGREKLCLMKSIHSNWQSASHWIINKSH